MKVYYGITILEWIFILIIVFAFVLYGWIIQFSPDIKTCIHSNINWVTVDKLLEESNNGDIILMSGSTKGEQVCKWWSGSVYSHVGLLFREVNSSTKENVVYVWESDVGQKTKEGSRIIKLSDKLKNYKGSKYFSWRKLNGPRPKTSSILKLAEKYINYEFDHSMLTWWTSSGILSPFYRLVKHENKTFCSEMVALTLQNEGILKLDHVASWYSPGTFEKKHIPGLNSSYSYSQLYMINNNLTV